MEKLFNFPITNFGLLIFFLKIIWNSCVRESRRFSGKLSSKKLYQVLNQNFPAFRWECTQFSIISDTGLEFWPKNFFIRTFRFDPGDRKRRETFGISDPQVSLKKKNLKKCDFKACRFKAIFKIDLRPDKILETFARSSGSLFITKSFRLAFFSFRVHLKSETRQLKQKCTPPATTGWAYASF